MIVVDIPKRAMLKDGMLLLGREQGVPGYQPEPWCADETRSGLPHQARKLTQSRSGGLQPQDLASHTTVVGRAGVPTVARSTA